AGSNGVVAVSGGRSREQWSRFNRAGLDRNDYYVLFLDRTRVRGEWKPDRPVTGPLAVGADGDLLVPLPGELVSVG
ncbi:hypothetical protein, partial [Actinophytocola sp.]|uniref:hypothetical protein n=1 Tax=Actinophytocola sp. TaxID=1872138 RepID=UPI00389A099D